MATARGLALAARMSINPNQLFLSQQPASHPQAGPSQPRAPPPVDENVERHRERKEEELKDKERALVELLFALSDPDEGQPADSRKGAYRPVIPDEVAQYYLQRVGFETNDVRVTRLLALAAQKFVADIASDTYAYSRTRTLAAAGVGQRGRPPNNPDGTAGTAPAKKNVDKSRTVLTMEDLSNALGEYGVNASRAPYYL